MIAHILDVVAGFLIFGPLFSLKSLSLSFFSSFFFEHLILIKHWALIMAVRLFGGTLTDLYWLRSGQNVEE
jgi:hypothetical protein